MERDEIPRYVPDASVAVKWFVDEEGSENAVRLKEFFANGKVDLEAPSMLNYEVAGALRFHPKIRMAPKQFFRAIRSLSGLQVTRDPTHTEWATAYTLTLDSSISI